MVPQVNEQTSRLVCRLGFLAGCIAPTLIVMLAICWHWLPFSRGAVEQQLTTALGYRVEIDSLATPQLNRQRLTGVKLIDPETGELVASVARLDTSQAGRMRIIWLDDVHVARGGIAALEEMTLRRVHQRLAADTSTVRMVLTDLNVATNTDAMQVANAALHFEPSANGAVARLELQLDEADTSKVKLNIVRQLQPTEGLRVQLVGNERPLPCALLAEMLPDWVALGDAATFAGNFTFERTASGWQGEVTGDFANLNLARLAQQDGQPMLSAEANLSVENATIRDGRLHTARGTVATAAGDVDCQWLAEFATALNLRNNVVQRSLSQRIAFDQINFAFQYGDGGLSLAGRCDASQTVMLDAWGPIVATTAAHRSQLRPLIETMAYEASSGQGTHWLTRRLPLLPRRAPIHTAQQPGDRQY